MCPLVTSHLRGHPSGLHGNQLCEIRGIRSLKSQDGRFLSVAGEGAQTAVGWDAWVTDSLLHMLPASWRDRGPLGPAWPPEVLAPQSTGTLPPVRELPR